MATHLLRSGYDLLIGDPHRAREGTEELRRLGAQSLAPGDSVDVYCTCLPRPSDVAAVIEQMALPPPLFIDFSTGAPQAALRMAADLSERGTRYVDAPVSGSIEAAGSGGLTCWVGAAELDHNVLAALLRTVAQHIFPMGSVGQGVAAKLVNQVVHISNMAVLGEGLALGRDLGLDPAILVDSLSHASADSAMVRRFGATIVANNFTPRFRQELALKDIQQAIATGCAGGTGTIVAIVAERLRRLGEVSGPGIDFSALAAGPAVHHQQRGDT